MPQDLTIGSNFCQGIVEEKAELRMQNAECEDYTTDFPARPTAIKRLGTAGNEGNEEATESWRDRIIDELMELPELNPANLGRSSWSHSSMADLRVRAVIEDKPSTIIEGRGRRRPKFSIAVRRRRAYRETGGEINAWP
jgi:hypothetical protein